MSAPVDRRRGPRVRLDAAAILRVEQVGPEVAARILNASETGMLLALPEGRPIGTRLNLLVQVADPSFEISVSGIIVHLDASQPPRAGVVLTEAGPDWRALCRRLARLHAGNP